MKEYSLENDIQIFSDIFPYKEELRDSIFIVTGATGLIGSTLIKCLLALNLNIRFLCPVRNKEKANTIFDINSNIQFFECPIQKLSSGINDNVDYIIHCACPTNGLYIKNHPIETFDFTYESTKSLLNLAKDQNVKGMVYLSSIEYYGQVPEDINVDETYVGTIDYSSPRSAYPLGKRMAEFLCLSYALEYGVNVKIARPTQTFGIGVSENDNRVFAQFARSITHNENIVLHTEGKSSKPYCYTIDCVNAILYILLLGKNGEAYNVANSETYISIKNLALYLKNTFNKKINVVQEFHPELGYAPDTFLKLNTDKLHSLGWKPVFNLEKMFEHLILSWK